MIWLEEKYINMLGPRLKLFSRVKHNHWVFRCPICNDSKKHAYKTRGTIYLHSRASTYTMGCFNCGASMSFVNFMKLIDPTLFNEFILERYKANQDANQKTTSTPQYTEDKDKRSRLKLRDLERISDLDDDHPAVKYLTKRKIDRKHWNDLYFVLRFKKWEKEFRGEKVYKISDEHPRLIIPFFDKQGNIFRLSARAFGKEQPKYIYMKIKEDASRVFGLDRVDPKKKIYVLEGPIDSLFIDNAIAVGSADLIVPELSSYNDVVLVPDNQPRNPEVCKSIKKMVDSGYPVCLWNEYIGKDINEAIMNGYSNADVKNLIDSSTVKGIAAQLKFASWIRTSL